MLVSLPLGSKPRRDLPKWNMFKRGPQAERGQRLKTQYLRSITWRCSAWKAFRAHRAGAAKHAPPRPRSLQLFPEPPGTQRFSGIPFSLEHWHGFFWAMLRQNHKDRSLCLLLQLGHIWSSGYSLWRLIFKYRGPRGERREAKGPEHDLLWRVVEGAGG